MRATTVILLVLLAAPAAAQEQEIRSANLPRELEWELLRLYENSPNRMEGDAAIAPGEVVQGDLAAMGGPLRVAGRVDGDLAMVGGDVIVDPTAEVTGSITVIGGEVRLAEGALIAGTITAYGVSDGPDRYHRDDDRGRWWERRDRRHRGDGFSRFTVRTGPSYNRVEGLPIMFGPVIETSGSSPLRLEALAIWRSEAGASLDTDRMGYEVRAQQFLSDRRLSFGGMVHSVIDPLDRWQIGDLEASLAAALFHDDFRDHYEREGWSAFVEARPVAPVTARVEYRQEDHASVAAGDPWSLFDGGDRWRLQPLVAEGELRSVTGSLELDLRDDRDDPLEGWYARVAIERAVGGDLVRPGLPWLLPSGGSSNVLDGNRLPALEVATDFTTGHLDLRRYTRVGWHSQLNARVVAGGSVTGDPVPPQFQHALGGPGTLPGFDTFYGDCGARSVVGRHDGARFFPSYGCDRFVLGQVEYRGDLSLGFGFGDPDYEDEDDWDWWDEVEVDFSPTWVVFFDAARGWAFEDGLGPDRDTGTLYDVGLGFLFGELGIYAALPLNDEVEQEPRFLIRLDRRF